MRHTRLLSPIFVSLTKEELKEIKRNFRSPSDKKAKVIFALFFTSLVLWRFEFGAFVFIYLVYITQFIVTVLISSDGSFDGSNAKLDYFCRTLDEIKKNNGIAMGDYKREFLISFRANEIVVLDTYDNHVISTIRYKKIRWLIETENFYLLLAFFWESRANIGANDFMIVRKQSIDGVIDFKKFIQAKNNKVRIKVRISTKYAHMD